MLISIILASISTSIISLAGAVLLIWKRFQTQKTLTHVVSFAAGVMITTAFLDLLPEAIEGTTEHMSIFLMLLLGVVTFFFLERFVVWFHHHDELHGAEPSSLLILLGDGLHNFIDGVAIAAAFLSSTAVGIATTLAIAAHEIPQEIADFSILLSNGIKKKRALFFNFISSLSALLGAVAGYFFLERLEHVIPFTLSYTAGMFLYIACSDLIPEMHKDFRKQKEWMQSISFLLGIAVTFASITFLSDH